MSGPAVRWLQVRWPEGDSGGVSLHEFWQDPSNRLTDEEWRAMLRDGDEPDRPSWQEVLFPN